MKNRDLDNYWVNWTVADIKRAAQQSLAYKQRMIAAVKKIRPAQRTFENTVVALENSNDLLQTVWQKIEVLINAHPNAKLRAAGHQVVQEIERRFIDLTYDEGIYRALVELASKKPRLSGPSKKLFQETLRDYRRLGFSLPRSKQSKIKAQFKQLSKLGSQFRKNINDYSDYILVNREELSGLPESFIAGLKKKNNLFQVSLDYPEYFPFMENAHSEVKRQELAEKQLRLGGQKNIKVLSAMLRLRQNIARQLGYKNHAAFVLEVKMAKRPAIVQKFLRSLMEPLRPKVSAELRQLEAAKRKITQQKTATLSFADILYLINQTRKERFQVDQEAVREYFPLDLVTKGMLEVYSKLLSVKFQLLPKVKTWHPDVATYEVSGKQGTIGHFYLDLYPREGKYGHAAVFPIVPGRLRPDGSYQTPLVAMIANFPKPSSGRPSLLSHREVETYFHEFGHVVHGVLTTAQYASQSGTSVQRDFVEAPSQMLENWTWDAGVLKLMSGHVKNRRKKIPLTLLKKLIAAKLHMIAYQTMRQLIFGQFDMRLHAGNRIPNPRLAYAMLVKEYAGLDLPASQMFAAGFGHLEGYDAGYYGYMWSKVYAADMFTRFQKEGLLNPKTGADYRKFILEPGSSEEAINLVKSFLKREPNQRAFLKEIGL
jgi:thimet oligopeptidase